ncbi:TPA: tail fiber assembly protein [Morganella morganii]|nr:tail fiber assembly protein [Morganella morganii]
MMKFGFSAKESQFFIMNKKDDYEKNGIWPDDIVEVDGDVMHEYAGIPPESKRLGADKKGKPAWVDIPPLTYEQHVAIAEAQKQALIAEASQKTQLWQTQLMLGIITEEDKASLKEWMLYVQEVQAVDPSPGADVVWPTPPASPAR